MLNYISPTQINFLTPTDIAPGPVTIQVTSNGLQSAAVSATAKAPRRRFSLSAPSTRPAIPISRQRTPTAASPGHRTCCGSNHDDAVQTGRDHRAVREWLLGHGVGGSKRTDYFHIVAAGDRSGGDDRQRVGVGYIRRTHGHRAVSIRRRHSVDVDAYRNRECLWMSRWSFKPAGIKRSSAERSDFGGGAQQHLAGSFARLFFREPGAAYGAAGGTCGESRRASVGLEQPDCAIGIIAPQRFVS